MFKLYGVEEFPWHPLMFWEDITYILKKIAEFFKSLLGNNDTENE